MSIDELQDEVYKVLLIVSALQLEMFDEERRRKLRKPLIFNGWTDDYQRRLQRGENPL